MDDESELPHSVTINNLAHFIGVKLPVLSHRKRIDILTGQIDKLLLTVLEEREGLNSDEPNYVLTRLGPIANGGFSNSRSNPAPQNLKVKLKENCDQCKDLKCEIVNLKESVQNYERENEEIQPSTNEEFARELVETNVKIKNGRYEMPVPFKVEKLLKRCHIITLAL